MHCATVNGVVDPAVFLVDEAYCRSLVTPARAYLAEQIIKPVVIKSVHLAKVASMWNPLKVYAMTLDDAMLAVRTCFSLCLLFIFTF